MKLKLTLFTAILSLLIPFTLSSCSNPLNPDVKKTKSKIEVNLSESIPKIKVWEKYKNPEELKTTIIKKGTSENSEEKVTYTNSVSINMLMVSKTGETIQNTFETSGESGYLTTIEASSPLVQGLKDALNEKQVGTKMIVEIPAGLAYGDSGYYRFDGASYSSVEIVAPNDPIIVYVEILKVN